MKIIEFTQGSDDWHKWRKNGLGASEISVIMGSNPYDTPLKLWEKKCGHREEDPVNAAMQHGIDCEPLAREWLNKHFQLNLKPICVEDSDKPHFRASLDGYDMNTQTLVEIKSPTSVATLERAIECQAIHDYWFDQIQWQMMITEPKKTFVALWDFRYKCCHTLEMFPHPVKILKMREKGQIFWDGVVTGRAPAPMPSDYIQVEDEDLRELLLEYQGLSYQEKDISSRKKLIKKQIEEFGDDGSFMAYGFKIQRMNPPSTYNIEQMRLDGIEVEKYIKKSNSIGFYKIYPPKDPQ